MGAIRFNLARPGTTGKTAVILVYHYGRRKRLKMTTGLSISPDHWDFEKRQAATTYKRHSFFNAVLGRIEARAEELVLAGMMAGKLPGPGELRRKIREHIGGAGDQNGKTLADYFEDLINVRTAARTVSYNTLKRYRVVHAKIKRFGDIQLSDVSVDWLLKFVAHIKRVDQLSDNSVATVMRVVRMILNMAEEEGLVSSQQFRSKRVRFTERNVVKIFLSIDELDQLNNVSLDGALANARDLFLLAAFTGQRYGDLHQFERSEIIRIDGRDHFKISQSKTGSIVHIPIHPMVREVMARNGGMPKVISNQKLNEYIKEVAKVAGLNEMVTVKEGADVKHVPKWSLVTTHTARRSAATNMYLAGISSRLICAITGHNSEAMLLKYIQANSLESAIAVGRVWG